MNKINFSYASKSEHNLAQRLLIKTIESATGKRKLENIYKEYAREPRDPVEFWSDIIKLMNIKIVNSSKKKLVIPSKGSLVVVSNHPFGIVDGLILCSLVSKFRKDFKIITHETLQFIPELEKFILPIDFSNSNKETLKKNIKTTQTAQKHLLDEGAVIIFPSGSVSIAKKINSDAKDDEWKLFPAKLIHKTRSNILPIFFDGKNGLLFHIFASKIRNQTLKYSTYIHETKKMIGKEIRFFHGDLIKYKDIEHIKDRVELTNLLKKITYSLKEN